MTPTGVIWLQSHDLRSRRVGSSRNGFSASGRAEDYVFCFGFGSFAAKTKAIKQFSLLPQAEKPRLEQPQTVWR
jgi:hypothetical protein